MIRIFVGCAPNHEDAESQAVLEYTLRKHASEEVQITWMRLSRNPTSPFYCDVAGGLGWRTERWATPFSGFRWAIPELCNYEGRGIYTDSDVMFFADVAELWRQEIPEGKVVLAKGGQHGWRYCVSVWDCERMQARLPHFNYLRSDPDAHSKLCNFFKAHPELVQQFEGNWNCLDGERLPLNDPQLKALHYTDMSTQPHLAFAMTRLQGKGKRHWYNGPIRMHPRVDVEMRFYELLLEADKNGFPVSKYEEEPEFGPLKKADLRHYRGAPR